MTCTQHALNMKTRCCLAIASMLKSIPVLQAVIVSIRLATHIGVTILVVALSYKLKKV